MMQRRLAFGIGGAVALGAVGLSTGAGCGTSSFGDCTDNNSCGGSDAGIVFEAGKPDASVADAFAVDVREGGPGDGAIDGSVDGTGGADGTADGSGDGSGDAGETTDAPGDGESGSAEAEAAPVIAACAVSGPPVDPCVEDASAGVFVSPSGSDASGQGTPSAPYATIAKGLEAAKSGAHRVFVCTGTYAERVVIGAGDNGVRVSGGIDCATRTYASSHSVRVKPAKHGAALEVTGVTTGVTVEDVAFEALDADAAHPGESSVGAFVQGSQGVTLARVSLTAGKGTAGAAGASFAPDAGAPDGGGAVASNWAGTPPAYGELNGIAATDTGGTKGLVCTCPDKTTSIGGNGGGVALAPGAGQPVPPGPDAGVAGAAGTNGDACGQGGTGNDGSNAPPSTAPTSSTQGATLTSAGLATVAGAPGPNGLPGQGGGGGGSGPLANVGGGGSGACGGCGGAGGAGGAGGGSSIALAVISSQVTLTAGVLVAQTAGAGGAGGSAEPGQHGGGPGGSPFGFGCSGGIGGSGSGGNGGQGGAGGDSLGIAFVGASTTVTIDGTALTSTTTTLPNVTVATTVASGGAGGAAGGAAASGASAGLAGANGPPGLSQAAVGF